MQWYSNSLNMKIQFHFISAESHKKKEYLDDCDDKCSYYAVTKYRNNKKYCVKK